MSTKNQLAQTANIFKKPSKAYAQEMILRIYEQCPDMETDLAQLYTYFMPSIPKKPKTPFDWVAKAIGKKDVRYYLNWVHVTTEFITATDGHRMHRAPNVTHLAPGFYDAHGHKIHEPDYAKFPDVERIVPRNDTMSDITTDMDTATIEVTGQVHAYRFASTNHKINTLYMDELLSYGSHYTIRAGEDTNRAIYAEYPDGSHGVVMPMRD